MALYGVPKMCATVTTTREAFLATIDAGDVSAVGPFADYLEEAEDDLAAAGRLVEAAVSTREPVRIGRKEYVIVNRGERGRGWWVFPAKQTRARVGRMCHDLLHLLHVVADIIRTEERKIRDRSDAAERKRALAADWSNPLKLGDLLYCGWGYDQTRYDFAQVVKVGPKSVTIRRIASRVIREGGFMAAIVSPVKDAFLSGNDGGEAKIVKFTFYVYEGKLHHRLPARHGSWSVVGDREEFYETYYG